VSGEAEQAQLARLCYDRCMIRTRDLVLFLACMAFLLAGIGVTGLSQLFTTPGATTAIQFNTAGQSTSSAELVTDSLDRQQRLYELQAKIASRDTTLYQPAVELTEEEIESESTPDIDESETDTEVVSLIQYCPAVGVVARSWPAADIVQTEREGRRIYITETSEVVTTHVGTTTAAETIVSETIYAHLPIRTSAGRMSCIGQDVIGIAQDGSLLRNENHVAYSIFGSDTLIGYALDGLPIYGLSETIVTDQCGGVVMNGQYRYYLSADRPGMIGCFAAAPVTL